MKLPRFVMTGFAFLLIPAFWIGFNLISIEVTLAEIFKEWKDYKNSGKAWGYFDK